MGTSDKPDPRILCVIIVFLMCNVQADISGNKVIQEGYRPGEISYFDTLRQLPKNVQTIKQIESNREIQDDMEHILKTFSRLRDDVVFRKMEQSLFSQGKSKTPPQFLNLMLESTNGTILSSQCSNDTGRVLLDLFNKTYYAEQMFDSIGKPSSSLLEGRTTWVGNYRQCRNAIAPPDLHQYSNGFKGTYTVATILFATQNLSLPLQWGLCFPNTCNEGEIYQLLNDALNSLEFNRNQTILYPVEIRRDEREATLATHFAIAIITIILAFMVCGTVYDVIFIQRHKWAAERVINRQEETDHEYRVSADRRGQPYEESRPLLPKPEPLEESGTLVKVILAFSVYTNAAKILNTHQPAGSLGAIHGIRFLSMSWVILGHTYVFGAGTFVNLFDINIYKHRWTFDAVANALVSVDTFFTLSGLLTAYVTVNEMKRKTWKLNWAYFYFHRFWRLTPAYMLILLTALGLQRYFGSGALWATVNPVDQSWCEKNWWTNLLYINNVVNPSTMCFGHSWYLSNDMQFYVLSPLMLIPFYFNLYAGLASCTVFLIITSVTTGVLSSQNDWIANSLGDADIMHPTTNVADWMTDYYIKPWCRIGPFVVGIMTGFFLAKYRGRIPLNKSVNVIGWIIATAAGLAIVYGLRGDISGDHPSSTQLNAFYNAVARSAWGVCVCWVILSCTSGYGGLVNKILSWSPFVVLGRLTYVAYLIHPPILYIYYQNMDQLFYLNNLNIIVTYLGILVVTNMVAFVLVLAFESPMIGLEKILIGRRKKE